MSIEYIEGNSFIHKVTPYTKLAFTFWVMTISLLLYDILSLLTYTGISLILWRVSKIPNISGRFKIIFTALSFSATMYVLAQGFFFINNATPLFILFEISTLGRSYGTFYLEGFLYGIAMALKLVAVIAVVPIFTLTTRISDFIYALDKMKVPYKFNFTLATAFRFTPMIISSIGMIQKAQTLRAHKSPKMNFIEKVRRTFIPIVIPLFISLLRKADQLDIAIESRAFGAPVKRTFYRQIKMTWRDYFLIIFMIAMTSITIYQVFLSGNGSIYPIDLLPWWLYPQR